MIASAHAADPAGAWQVPAPVLRGAEPATAVSRLRRRLDSCRPRRFTGDGAGFISAARSVSPTAPPTSGRAPNRKLPTSSATTSLAPHVAGWTTLSKVEGTKQMYGGFVGYNAQWEGDFILGAELNYSRFLSGGLYGSSIDLMTRQFSDDAEAPAQHHYFYTASVTSSASARITDYATARARAGFVFDRLLPYAFVGGALGRVDIVRSATVSYTRQDIPDNVVPAITPLPTFNFGPQTKSEQQKDAIAYGFTTGVGVDFAVTQNVFVRAEYEYIGFLPVHDFKIRIGTGRLGVGIKF